MYIIKLCKRYKRQNSHYFLDYKLNPEEDSTKALKHVGLVSNKIYTIDPVTLLGLFIDLNILTYMLIFRYTQLISLVQRLKLHKVLVHFLLQKCELLNSMYFR